MTVEQIGVERDEREIDGAIGMSVRDLSKRSSKLANLRKTAQVPPVLLKRLTPTAPNLTSVTSIPNGASSLRRPSVMNLTAT